jgi:hypothetical protein
VRKPHSLGQALLKTSSHPSDPQFRSTFLEVHALAVEQNNGEAILLIKKGGASYRIFVHSYRLHNRTAGDPQQDSYQFLTLLQPSAAMLHQEHVWEVGRLSREGDEAA